MAERRRLRRLAGWLALWLAGVLPGAGAYAQASSTEGAGTLLLPLGGRAVGMSRAVTAFRGSESAFWNPAGLALIPEGRFVVMRGTPLVGEATAFSLIFARQPLGVLAISYRFLDKGEFDVTDSDSNIIGTATNREHLGIVSFSTQIIPSLEGGLNFKVYHDGYTCRGECVEGPSGTTYALDLGVIATPLESLPLRIGAMAAHLGPDLQIINSAQADPLPSRLRLAVAYEVLWHFPELTGVELWVTTEVEDRILELGSPLAYFGTEFLAGEEDRIFVRAGYGQGQAQQPAGASVGMGLRYQQFEVGIAKVLATSITSESEPFHITFGVRF